jgi:hypothetical protein
LLATLPLALAALRPLTDTAAPAAPDAGALAHCASISAADERLACYDSLARPKSSPAAAASSASTSGKASPHAAAASGAPATSTGAATAAPPAAAAGTAAASPAADPAKSFGLTKHTAPSDPGPDHIRAKVTRVDTNRLGNVRVSLDNGEAWTFNAPEALIRVGDAITIKRGVLGSFLLTTPAHHTYKAQRSQ